MTYSVERNDDFDAMLDECHDGVVIAGITFTASDILFNCDPIAYSCALSDWGDANEEEESDEEDSEEWVEDEEATEYYLINDEKGGAKVIKWYSTFQEACDAADERYNTLGLQCHVEAEGCQHLYNPKHNEV